MLGFLTRSRPRPASRPHSVRLSLEWLEGRNLMSAPSIMNFTATTLPDHVAQLSGMVADANPGTVQITFSGAATGSTTANSAGNFSYSTTNAVLGSVTAVAVNQQNVSSNPVTATLRNAAPVITSFNAVQGSGGYWTFSGTVTDDTPAGATVTFAGLPELAGKKITVNADGTFSYTVQLQPGESGMVTAQATDVWGQTSNVARDLVG